MRTFERALRRANFPLAYTKGFNPHPKLNFSAPLSVGVIGECEYVDIEMITFLDKNNLASDLGKFLPSGFKILEAFKIKEGISSIMALVEWADYEVELDLEEALVYDEVSSSIENFLALEQVVVNRETKKCRKKNNPMESEPIDIRLGIIALKIVEIKDNKLVLEMRIKAGSEGNIKPMEVVDFLTKLAKWNVVPYGIKIKRKLILGANMEGIPSICSE